MFIVLGRPWSIASELTLNDVANCVNLYSLLMTTLGTASRLSSTTTRVFSSDSSRTAEMSVIVFSLANAAIFWTSVARLTRYGICVMTICSRLPFICSTPTRPRCLMLPRPVLK